MKIFIGLLLVVSCIFSATVHIELAKTKPNGKDWDGLGGGAGADIYIVVDGNSYREFRCQDTFKCKIKINEDVQNSTTINVEVWDADAVDDDLAGDFTLKIGDIKKNDSVSSIYIDEFSVLADDLDDR